MKDRLRMFVSFCLIALGGWTSARAQPLAITHVTVIDTTGGAPQRDVTVIIRDGRIESIGHINEPADATLVDGRGRFLIPGLWDMHVHLSWTSSSALPVLVANGVTSVRDMGGRLGQLDEWRTKIAAGLVAGPRIFRAGPMLNGRKFNQYQMVPGSPEETRGVARALKEIGVDFLKVHRRLPRDAYYALIDEAKHLGITVVGHIPMTLTPEEASDAGQATIEHTETLFEGTFTAGVKGKLSDAIRQFRESAEAQRLFERFVKNHTVVTPTLAAWTVVLNDPASPPDPRIRYVAKSLRNGLGQLPRMSADELQELRDSVAEYREVVRLMNQCGVTLMAGTDIAGPRIPGFTLHDELAALVGAGLTTLEALQAATYTPAKIMNRSQELGSIEPGKVADLVLLDANPLEDIRNTQKIAAVIIGGQLLRRADLDALLHKAEELAARN